MKKHLLNIMLIVVLASLFYLPSLHNDFIWDDDEYVYNNVAVQRTEGLRDIWLSYKMPQYYPLVFTTFWVEHKLWGLDPYGYHAVNLALHIANAVLIYIILLRLYPPLALATGLLFALHPVQVETVAWVTERKNLLGGLFYLLAILCYVRFFETKRLQDYLCSFVAFVLALLSKSITVSFVVVPLFIKWWRGEKIVKADIVALLPFGLVGLACGINTVFLELYRVGAKGEEWALSFAEHLILPGQIILFYLAKIVFPHELVFFYPKWRLDAGQPWQWLPLVAVILLGALLYRQRETLGRGAFANYLYFICAIFPALGVFNVYPMLYSYVADHFQYLASINLIILLAGAGMLLFDKLLLVGGWHPGARTRMFALYAVLGVVVVLYGMKTVQHSRTFANLETLWKDVINKNYNSSIAHNNLGIVYKNQAKNDEAITEFKKTLAIDPKNILARNNLAICYYALGMEKEALLEFNKVLELDKNYASVYNNIGLIYLNSDHPDKSHDYFVTALRINPDLIEGHYNLAQFYLRNNQYDKAIAELLIAIDLYPQYYDAMDKLAQVFDLAGDAEQAVHWYRQAIAVNSELPLAHNGLGGVLARRGALREAMVEFQLALQGDPNFVDALVNLGNALLVTGETERAAGYLRRAMELGATLPPDLQRLAAGAPVR